MSSFLSTLSTSHLDSTTYSANFLTINGDLCSNISMNLTKLKLIRLCRNLKQFDVEDGTKIPHVRLSHLETGRRPPKDEELEKLAQFYGVTVEAITGNVEGEFELGVIS